MSMLLGLMLAGGLSEAGLERALVAGDPVTIQSPSSRSSSAAGRKKTRRPARPTPPTPETNPPALDDLPLGAQDLLQTTPPVSPSGGSGRQARPRALDNYDFGASPARGEAEGTEAEGSEGNTEAAPSPEEAWRRALEEARTELREAQEEKQRQDNADSPPSPEQDAAQRIVKARETIRRLLEEGKAKQYREQPSNP